MRRLILKMQLSLDGFVGNADGDVAFIFTSFDDALTAWIVASLWRPGCTSWVARPMATWRHIGRARPSPTRRR